MFPELAASTVALIVNELVTNSMKYAFHGRDHGKIELTMESGEEFAWFTVEDDGCGMEKSGGERGRGGLGLNLVQSLVKSSLKGDLFIEEREGGGVKIRFSVRRDLYA